MIVIWNVLLSLPGLAGQPEPGSRGGGEEFDLRWNTIDSGGVTSSAGGDFELSGTLGQADAGPMMSGGEFELQGGFWFEVVPGDCNSDSGINLFDFDEFRSCLSGPDVVVNGADCWCGNLDGDEDVDLRDVALLQLAFTP
jgi:hypothetical protein